MALESTLPQINQKRVAFNKTSKRLPPNQPEWRYPFPVEKFYDGVLQGRINIQEEFINSIAIKNLPSIAQERNEEVPESMRADAYGDSINRLLIAVRLSFEQVPVNTTTLAETVGDQTNTWNSVQWQRQLRTAFGVDIVTAEPFINPAINSFVNENVLLIKKMDVELLDNIEGIMQRGFRSGQSSANIAKEIESQIGVTRRKAKFIARDQIGKLNGQLTEMRQSSIGINTYTWRTSADERVRASHAAKGGKTFKWNSPPSGTGHPGQDYQCRCYAEPNFEDVFKELGV